MKRFVYSLLALGAIAVFVAGCNPKEETTADKAAAAAKQPAAEKPMDHPAH